MPAQNEVCLASAHFLDERLFKALKINGTSYWAPASKMSRLVQPLAVDVASGQPIKVIDVSKIQKTIPVVPTRRQPRQIISVFRRCCSPVASAAALLPCRPALPSRDFLVAPKKTVALPLRPLHVIGSLDHQAAHHLFVSGGSR